MSKAPSTPETGTTPILQHALEVLRSARPTPGDLIDLPCGSGYLSRLAAETGWRVSPADLHPELWVGDPNVCVQRADLDGQLPFPTAAADALVCCEGLEHVENPWNALRELHRVLRPCGDLILSLPNTIDLRQRFRMLLRGYWGHYLPDVPDHINAMGTFMLCHALLRSGFAIHSISSPKQYGGFRYRGLAKLFPLRSNSGLPREVCRMLSQPEVLCARTVIVHARTLPQERPTT